MTKSQKQWMMSKVHNGFSPLGRRINDPFFDVVAEFTELTGAGRMLGAESDLILCGADTFANMSKPVFSNIWFLEALKPCGLENSVGMPYTAR
jgi:hypothetical protein